MFNKRERKWQVKMEYITLKLNKKRNSRALKQSKEKIIIMQTKQKYPTAPRKDQRKVKKSKCAMNAVNNNKSADKFKVSK